jgi:HAD superfamily hydrolase (TIGR01549 family)
MGAQLNRRALCGLLRTGVRSNEAGANTPEPFNASFRAAIAQSSGTTAAATPEDAAGLSRTDATGRVTFGPGQCHSTSSGSNANTPAVPTVTMVRRIEAVTCDFFDTLVFHRSSGRTRRLKQYFETQGFRAPAWDERSLYRVLERHGIDYSPSLSHFERRRYRMQLAVRVFAEAGLPVTQDEAEFHADALWAVLGPSAFDVFPDAVPTLRSLRERGVRLAIVSNWHCGLAHYVAELSLAPYFDHVIGSADVGFGKPDPRIFEAARVLLGVPAGSILHVGDTYADDYIGGRSAGYQAALLSRRDGMSAQAERVIRSLGDLLAFPGFDPSTTSAT